MKTKRSDLLKTIEENSLKLLLDSEKNEDGIYLVVQLFHKGKLYAVSIKANKADSDLAEKLKHLPRMTLKTLLRHGLIDQAFYDQCRNQEGL